VTDLIDPIYEWIGIPAWKDEASVDHRLIGDCYYLPQHVNYLSHQLVTAA
jgi:hypothetical protein